jgi:hypothetical protein
MSFSRIIASSQCNQSHEILLCELLNAEVGLVSVSRALSSAHDRFSTKAVFEGRKAFLRV